jgi:hypothetical protein
MPVERREQVTRVGTMGQLLGRMNPFGFGGRRQPSVGGTSRISREAYVRFCERLGVKFPGPTRRRVSSVLQLRDWKVYVNLQSGLGALQTSVERGAALSSQ